MRHSVFSMMVVGILSSCASPQEGHFGRFVPHEFWSREFASDNGRNLKAESVEVLRDFGGKEPHRSWEIRLPSVKGRGTSLVLSPRSDRVNLIVVGRGNGAMAPKGDLFLCPPPGELAFPWKLQFPIMEAEEYSMSVTWAREAETVATSHGRFNTRRVELALISDAGPQPILTLWLAEDVGIVRYADENAVYTWVR